MPRLSEVGAALLGGGAFVAGALLAAQLVRSRDAAPPPSVSAAREQRQQAVAEIAPAPTAGSAAAPATLPAAFPLVGPDEVDGDGYPLAFVDRAALRSLLLQRRYAELTEVVERLQAGFEADPRKEYWPADAGDALGTREASLEPLLDEWVRASPESFAPLLARGTHWIGRAFARRGGKWTSETPREDLAAMDDALARALADLESAIQRRPRLVAAMRQELMACRAAGGRREGAEVLRRALEACPSCFQIRVTYLYSLTPRWGGSYEAMQRFIKRSPARDNPRMRLLPGYLELDRADRLSADGRHAEALAASDRSLRLGEHWEFLAERGRLRLAARRTEDALADLDRASELRPGHPNVIFERASALTMAQRWEEAGRELRAGLQVDPAHRLGRHLHGTVVKGLVWAAWQRHEASDRDGALRILDLAAELAPLDREVQGRRAFIVSRGEPAPAGGEDPPVADDFRSVQRADYALARQGRYDRVLPLWDDFLSRHPDEGRAWLERGGALFHMGRRTEAAADAQKACELGVSEGCVRARQLGGGG